MSEQIHPAAKFLIEQIDQLTADRADLRAKLEVALLGHGDANKAKCAAVDKWDGLRSKLDQVKACCAEMRDIFLNIEVWNDASERVCPSCNEPFPIGGKYKIKHSPTCRFVRALSTSCGKGYRSPEDYAALEAKVKVLREALELLLNSILCVPYLHSMDACICSKCTAIRTAKQALRETGGEK